MADAIARRTYDHLVRNEQANAAREIRDVQRLAAGLDLGEPAAALSDAQRLARTLPALIAHLASLKALEEAGFLTEENTND